ncbi:hypothetical protein NQ317_011214 [Molorchus minor]|uniref:Uncharacterized protein n=1 Tax=Molorchus minor TaxID=1323400 RepID=A0ABQ9JGR1_9CUCU|nr:hypothetical protein NQ317_011214 [Molorchus minor]
MRLKHSQQQSESGNESLSEEENPQSSKYASRQVFSASEEAELEQYFFNILKNEFWLNIRQC